MLRRELHWPLLAKDAYKETLFDTLGCRDREWSRSLSRASYALMFAHLEELLDANVHCIVEANFRAGHEPRLRGLLARHKCIQVLCKAEGRVLMERFAARAGSGSRHPGHVDLQSFEELRPELLIGRAEPLRLQGSLFEYDSSTATPAETSAFIGAISALARREAA